MDDMARFYETCDRALGGSNAAAPVAGVADDKPLAFHPLAFHTVIVSCGRESHDMEALFKRHNVFVSLDWRELRGVVKFTVLGRIDVIRALVRDCGSGYLITEDDLPRPLGVVPHAATCSSCGGTGRIWYEPGQTMNNCLTCSGAGKVFDFKPHAKATNSDEPF